MTDDEFNKYSSNRPTIIDLLSHKEAVTSNGDSKKTGKLSNLFEIQNTLDDTIDTIDTGKASNGNGTDDSHKLNGNGHQNGDSDRNKICVEDTDPEDEDETNNSNAEFHLEMSHSIINQSVYSCELNYDNYICRRSSCIRRIRS